MNGLKGKALDELAKALLVDKYGLLRANEILPQAHCWLEKAKEEHEVQGLVPPVRG